MPSHSTEVTEQQHLRARALELGNANGGAELLELAKSKFPEVRRLAASALGKIAPFQEDSLPAAFMLAELASADDHPQVRQYALKAIGKYGKTALPFLDKLRDVARDANLKEYVRVAAAIAIAAIQKEHRRVTSDTGSRATSRQGPTSTSRNSISTSSTGGWIRQSKSRT